MNRLMLLATIVLWLLIPGLLAEALDMVAETADRRWIAAIVLMQWGGLVPIVAVFTAPERAPR